MPHEHRAWQASSAAGHSHSRDIHRCWHKGKRGWLFILAAALLCALTFALFEPQSAYAVSNTPDNIGIDRADVSRGGGCTISYDVDCREQYYEFDPAAGGIDGRVIARIFSATVCNVEQLIGEVFAQMWCRISEAAKVPLTAVITLYITILGLLFVMGMVPMTKSEVVKRIMTVVLVWVFVTQSEFALDIAFDFFIFATREGVDIVLTDATASGYGSTDARHYTSEQTTTINSVGAAIYNLDEAAESIFGGPEDELITFFAGALALASSAPGGAVIGSALIAEALFSFFVFVSAVIAYLVAITGAVFLLTLGPIFISFALFQKTKPLFEKWLKHIVSFALQPMIIFAYLIIMENYIGGVKNLFFDPEVFNTMMIQHDTENPAINQNMGPLTTLMSIYEINTEPCAGPDCDTVAVDSNWGVLSDEFQAFAEEGLEPTFIGMVALLILDFVTLSFLKMVPEIARQLTNAPRVLKLGGGDPRRYSFAGDTVSLPGSGMFENLRQGAVEASKSGGSPEQIYQSAVGKAATGVRAGVENSLRWLGRPPGG